MKGDLVNEENEPISNLVGMELIYGYVVVEAYEVKVEKVLYDRFCSDITAFELPKINGLTVMNQTKSSDESMVILKLFYKNKSKNVSNGFEMGNVTYDNNLIMDELYKEFLVILSRKRFQQDINKTLTTDYYQIGNYRFFYTKKLLEYNNAKLKLTKLDANLLKMLYVNKNEIVSRDYILDILWHGGHGDKSKSRCLDVYKDRLQNYLKNDPSIKLINIKGEGIILKL